MGIRFLATIQPFLGPISMIFYMSRQETIVCRLYMRELSLRLVLALKACFGGKMGMAAKGSGALNPNQKVSPMGEPFV